MKFNLTMSFRSQQQRGFTLLEMLLAMLLIALIMVMAYSGFKGAFRATRSGEKVLERTTDLRAAYQFVHRQLERVLPLAYTADSEGIVVFEGDRSRVRFVALMPGYLGSGGPYVQELSLERAVDKDAYELLFRFAVLQSYKDGVLDEVEPVILLTDIYEGQFRYLGFDDQGQLGDWDEEWPMPSIAPTAINLDIEMLDEVQITWPEMKAAVMVDSSVGGLLQNQVFSNTGGDVDAVNSNELGRGEEN